MQGKEGNHLNRLAFCTVTICAVLFIFTLAASAIVGVTISGTVYGFNEVTGIAQVTVKCTSGGSVVGQGITNSTGQYSFQVPGGTSCTMTASGPPTGYKYYFVDNPRDIYSIQSDRGGENFIAGYQVWGSVFEVGYSTKIGDVDILCDASGSLRDYRTKSLASGADAGKYFVVLKAGTSCSLSASKAGYAFISSQYKTNYITIGNIGDNMGYEDFINSVSTIPTTHSITGKVYEGTDSSSGTGIYGAVVKCTDTSYQTYQSQSLSDGRYTISGVPHGTICSTVIAEKSGYTFTARTSLTVSSDLSNIDFKGISLHSMILNLVTEYYNDILDRPPEPGGAEGWTAEVERVMALGIDVKEGFIALGKFFFNSNEYLAKRKTNTAFVTDLYQAFLKRTPVQSEVEYWVGYLTQGLSRSVLLNSFVYSADFSLYMDGIFGVGVKRPEPNLVNDFYRGLLNRLPETAGFNSYLALMRTAQCSGPQQVRDLSSQTALGFLRSAEYTFRNRTNAQFVEDLYNGILRRGAVPEEINYWVNFLNSGTYNREQELAFFTSSDEFQLRVQEVIEAGCLSF
jgi:hypothetical protein